MPPKKKSAGKKRAKPKTPTLINDFTKDDMFKEQETCKNCQVESSQHVGKTCKEILEERDEVRTRVHYEERMTAARVRKCINCSTGLIKSEGCNQITCRCGSLMCYLCREPITGHDHFCLHSPLPGAPCRQCPKCSIWTDPEQEDEQAIQEIQKEWEAELKKVTGASGKIVYPLMDRFLRDSCKLTLGEDTPPSHPHPPPPPPPPLTSSPTPPNNCP